MQSVCSLLPPEYFDRVVEARALVAEDPLLGAIYDPPFAHFTHQLAEEYDWDGLTEALRDFARTHEPFRARTAGIQAGTGQFVGFGLGVPRDSAMLQYHTDIWLVVSKFAQGRIDQFYQPNSILPHVTIKRCGSYYQNFGDAMTRLATQSFSWEFTVDSVSVQCDPGHNSQTHYQRIYFPLGANASTPVAPPSTTNATIESVTRPEAAPHLQVVRVQLDSGARQDIELSAPAVVRLMAAAKSSTVHWPGGRCLVDGGTIASVSAKPPFPIV